MEQQSGASGWGMLSPTPLPGEIRLWTLQAARRAGAEGVLYFRWRTARTGTEQYWHGILSHTMGAQAAGSRKYSAWVRRSAVSGIC